ncbi:HAD-IIIA family hydrolase [Eubacteriales bacterium OttesenSCG-928-G02]|nr:HAD-IIIA family hydrolase [Eubacteriales bacterium OttesenSCG-928-G02]
MSYKTLLFDLDGTLLDTLADLTQAVNYAMAEMDFPLRTREEVCSFIGSGVPTLIKRAVPIGTEKNLYDKALTLFSAYYTEHMTDLTKPFEGIIDLLERLKQNGYNIAVVSNKKLEATIEICKNMLAPYYDFAIGATGESDRKPLPEMVYRALEFFKATPDTALYIGDSDVDVLTSKNAGVKNISVLWGYRTKEQLSAAGAELFAQTPEQLFDIIDRMK